MRKTQDVYTVPSNNRVGFTTNSSHATVTRGDAEVDRDDWSRVIFSYTTEIKRDKEIWMTVVWKSIELNGNRSRGDTEITNSRGKKYSVLMATAAPSRAIAKSLLRA